MFAEKVNSNNSHSQSSLTQSLILDSYSKFSKFMPLSSVCLISYFCLYLSCLIIFSLKRNLQELAYTERLSKQIKLNIQQGMPNLPKKTLNNNQFEILNKRGLHFMHVNINSILPKLEELKYIVNSAKLSVIGISESKLDNSVDDSEICIPGYNILRKDRNRNGGGVLAYIKDEFIFQHSR